MIIEGVDDLVIVFTITVFIVVFLIINFFRRSNYQLRLHPDSIDDVNLTRQLIQQQNEQQQQQQQQQQDNQTTATTAAYRRSNRQRSNSLQCPICLASSELPIETNCGHVFCANCIIQHWHIKTNNSLYTSVPCPICRQQVTMILPLFPLESTNGQNNNTSEEYTRLITFINRYNKKFSGAPRQLIDYIYDLPTLLRHLVQELFSVNGITLWYRMRIIFFIIVAIGYLLSPLDIIPESVFGIFGLIDDVFIFIIMAIYITVIYRQVIANRG